MGIGAGWYEHEWRAYGYGFPSAGERLQALREGVEIMRQAWTTGYATLDGSYYSVDGARVWPRPLQDNGIPLWIAGGGEKVTLRIAARYAQYTNFGGDPETFTRKSELLREHCADVGTDFDAIVRSSNFNTVIAETEAEVADRLDAIEARLVPHLGADGAARALAEYRAGTSAGVGTPEQVIEKLQAVRDLGLGYAIHNFPESAYDRSGVELFEREVLPALS
jgi:alkanesulfonate monooxygenase SsuD/methylene tetrahydromethanopterin reductase-like flavin-dependent oxidoreductase (luciferase family)